METGLIVHIWKKLEELDMPLELFPYMWDMVGFKKVQILLGKKSGKTSIKMKLDEKGVTASDRQMINMLEEVKRRGSEKRDVLSDEEIDEIISEVLHRKPKYATN